MSELYTASRIRAFRSCPRKEHYQYDLGIRTPSGPAAQFGTDGHSALEAWYRQWQHGGDRLGAAVELINTVENPIDAIRLRAIVAAYHTAYGNEDWEIIAVEQEFRYWLGDAELGGKIDAIIRERSTRRAYVLEHKFTAQDISEGSSYWQKLSLDSQLTIYLDAAAFALDIPVAGAIYDVCKRPLHEPLKATPDDQIGYTIGKGCKACGGSAKAGEIVQGRGYLIVNFASVVEHPPCADCKGTGWKCDPKTGEPQAPRPYAKNRLADETLDEFEGRIFDEIGTRRDDYLKRATIVRLDSEMPRRRDELIEQIEAMRRMRATLPVIAPPNHDACAMGREMCGFFTACSGQADISDERIYPRGNAHPELAAITNNAA